MSAQPRTAVVAFVPVLHSGYISFIGEHLGDVYIFGEKLIADDVHLSRDIRAVPPETMAEVLGLIFPGRKIMIAGPETFKEWSYSETIMPEDEVCSGLVSKYLANTKVKFVPVFLRWTKMISFKEFEIPPDRKVTSDEFHRSLIEAGLKEAQKSSDWWRQIAAIVVKDGKVIYTAHNHHLPTDFHLSANGDPRSNFDAGQHQNIFTSIHAEAAVIAQAARDGKSLKGVDLYATTFPCPNCARLIGTAGVKRVFYKKGYSLLDAEQILQHFGVEIILVN